MQVDAWPSCAAWMISGRTLDLRAALPVQASLGDVNQRSITAMKRIADQLLAKAWEENNFSPGVEIRGGILRPGKHGNADESKIYAPRAPRTALKSSSKSRLVWVANLDVLELLAEAGSVQDLRPFGSWCWCTGEGSDQMRVAPRLQDLPGPDKTPVAFGLDEAIPVIMLVGPDLHRYMLVYESLKNAVGRCVLSERKQVKGAEVCQLLPRRFRGAHFDAELPLLRAWLGLKVPSSAPVDCFFGTGQIRRDLLRAAEEAVGLWEGSRQGFSAFQRDRIMALAKFVTKFGYIAGAGKTKTILALAHMARHYCKESLVWIAAATNKVSEELHERWVEFTPEDELVHLAVGPGSGLSGYTDHGWNWLQHRIECAMPVETAILSAVDATVKVLQASVTFTREGFDAGNCPVRQLLVLLLALRHEYLDEHVYGQCEKAESLVIDKVRGVVSSVSTLLKVNGCASPWSCFFGESRRLVLLLDEVNSSAFEEATGCLTEFDLLVCAGDGNQVVQEQKQDTRVEPKINVQSRGPQPLQRHNAGQWADGVAKHAPSNVDASSSLHQYRFGPTGIAFVKYVFPEHQALSCPVGQPDTMVIPWFFGDLRWYGDWVYHNWDEVLRSRFAFAGALGILAVELVLAYLRGVGKEPCQILILWGLLKPLKQFQDYVAQNFKGVCEEVHGAWDLPEPLEGCSGAYNFYAWLASERITFKYTQNAHGTDAEVVLWFLVRRKFNDHGLLGEQTFNAYLFEAMTRAKLRLHVLGEHLHEQNTRNSRSSTNMALAKRAQKVLRVFEHCDDLLVKVHGLSQREVKSGGSVPDAWERVVPPFFRSQWCLRHLADVPGGRIFNRTHMPSIERLLRFTEGAYDAMHWKHSDVHATQQNPKFRTTFQLLQLQDKEMATEWIGYWSEKFQEGREKPEQRRQDRQGELRDFTDYEVKAAEGSVPLDIWSHMCIPALTVHLQKADPRFESEGRAFHHAAVMIPVAPTLIPGVWDVTDFIFMLGGLVADAYAKTERGREVQAMGALELRYVHHKRFQYELGGLRFVVAACASDRLARVLHFTPSEEGVKPFEMMHMYNAMGLNRQHHLQETILVRLRDFALVQVVIDVTQSILRGLSRVAVRAVNKDPVEQALLMKLWYDGGRPEQSKQATTLASIVVTDAVKAAGKACAFSDCESFLRELFARESTTGELLDLVDAVIATIPAASVIAEMGQGPEPCVHYQHERPDCQSPPGEVVLPVLAARLMWGGLSPVLNRAWLEWQGVTHVLNCLGAKRKDGAPDPYYDLALQARLGDTSIGDTSIEYIDFCINHFGQRSAYLPIFVRLENILKNPNACLYVHCRNGKDRSAITVYALLRVRFFVDADTAASALQSRKGTHGAPVANLTFRQEKIREWIDQILAE